MNFNLLDLLSIIILVASAVAAFIRGFAAEAISLMSGVLGFILAMYYYSDAASILEGYGVGALFSAFLGFIGLFLLTLALGSSLAYIVDRIARKMRLKWIDRLLGAAFGLLRGALICMVIFLALTAFPIRKNLVAESEMAEFFLAAASIAAVGAPEDLRERFREGYDWLFQKWVRDTNE